MIAETANPEGRLVLLAETAWKRVLDQHVEMSGHLADTIAAIRAPDHREPDPRVGRERYFARGGPLRWIRVVTELHGDVDLLVTAFPPVQRPA